LDRARKIFGAALGLCPQPALFREYRNLERAAGSADRDERLRKIFEAQVAKFPVDVSLWVEYAEFELVQQEHLRSDAILAAAIELFKKRSVAFSNDRSVLEDLDALWKARLQLSFRRPPPPPASAQPPVADRPCGHFPPSTIQLFELLVSFCYELYTKEFEAWRGDHLANGTPGVPPQLLPKSIVVGAVERLVEAVRAMIRFSTTSSAGAGGAVVKMREFLSDLVDRARKRGNSWVELDAGRELSFLQLQDSKHLTELFVAPMYREWAAFEAKYGDGESLKAVTTSAEAPVKKRTRLFKK
jgi:hypothetical protein